MYGVLIKELIDKKAYLGIFAALRKQQAKTFTTAAMLRELHLIPGLRPDLLLRSKVNTLKPRFARKKQANQPLAVGNQPYPPASEFEAGTFPVWEGKC